MVAATHLSLHTAAGRLTNIDCVWQLFATARGSEGACAYSQLSHGRSIVSLPPQTMGWSAKLLKTGMVIGVTLT